MSLGGGNPQLQKVAQQIEEIEEQQAAIEEEIERLQAEKQDMNEAIEAVEELETGSTVQVPVGGDAYVRAEVADIDEVVVSLGGGYAAERDQDGAVDTLETKQDTLDERIEEMRSDLGELESESERLEERAQEMQSDQLQQMQQQQQQQDE
jgi:prefoldin alpha subunit